jgi:hypothetical protein
MLDVNVQNMQKIPNVLVVASKEIGLETNTGEISI